MHISLTTRVICSVFISLMGSFPDIPPGAWPCPPLCLRTQLNFQEEIGREGGGNGAQVSSPGSNYNFIMETNSLTASTDLSKDAFSSAVRSISITCSTPLPPSLTGTPTKRPL